MDVKKELGDYISCLMTSREDFLINTGKLPKGKQLSIRMLATSLGVSAVWLSSVIKGEKEASDKLLLRIADFFEIDEDEIFKVARKIHPKQMEIFRKEYLGEYYVQPEDDAL